eukprot:1208595-Rhodomonas_salina.1
MGTAWFDCASARFTSLGPRESTPSASPPGPAPGSPEEARSDEATARRQIGEKALPNDAACVRRGWAVRVLRIESEFRGRALDATVPLTSRTRGGPGADGQKQTEMWNLYGPHTA